MAYRDLPPERLVSFARDVEAMPQIADLWVVEDLGWAGAVSSAATALAVTSRLRVGIGIMPAPLRNPALLAMELGTLARLHPGRLAAGLGHGVRSWMRQVGAAPRSPLSLLEETLTAARGLLKGERVTLHGREARLEDVGLVHPPSIPPPLLAGVEGPRSLALSGRLADGTILHESFGPRQVATALTHIAPPPGHELVVFTYLHLGEPPGAIVDAVAEFQGVEPGEAAMAAGSAVRAADHVRALAEAGAATVVLRPPVCEDPLRHVSELLGAL